LTERRATRSASSVRAVKALLLAGAVSKTGRQIYHAMTEANDPRVTIDATPCTDVMSGKSFEATVTVTLNGQTYHGSGEALR
jgi:hypothetical protein